MLIEIPISVKITRLLVIRISEKGEDMRFWIFMFIITLLIPAALLTTWLLCRNLKMINYARGYRTKRSMKNQDTWEFAQKYCARISLYLFFPSLFLAIGVMPSVISKPINRIGWTGLGITVIQMISFLIIILSTEKSLKKSFDEIGNRA